MAEHRQGQRTQMRLICEIIVNQQRGLIDCSPSAILPTSAPDVSKSPHRMRFPETSISPFLPPMLPKVLCGLANPTSRWHDQPQLEAGERVL